MKVTIQVNNGKLLWHRLLRQRVGEVPDNILDPRGSNKSLHLLQRCITEMSRNAGLVRPTQVTRVKPRKGIEEVQTPAARSCRLGQNASGVPLVDPNLGHVAGNLLAYHAGNVEKQQIEPGQVAAICLASASREILEKLGKLREAVKVEM